MNKINELIKQYFFNTLSISKSMAKFLLYMDFSFGNGNIYKRIINCFNFSIRNTLFPK